MMKLIRSLVKDTSRTDAERLKPIVTAINALEPEIQTLSDAELRERFTAIRQEIQEKYAAFVRESDPEIIKKKTQALLDVYLPRVFAHAREASNRALGMRQYDVQLIGGIVLHQGKIAEMRTGEGKTLVAALPLILNALLGKGAHLVTVNDYLAKRDAGWNAPLYHMLGLSLAYIGHESSYIYDPSVTIEGENDPRLQHFRAVSRPEAYAADITYGTNNEFGFDYLRDHMVGSVQDLRQRPFQFAIVDEVDSILIDEARTPLIISGPAAESTSLYATFAQIVPSLKPTEDFTVDEKHKAVSILDSGIAKVEQALGVEHLYDGANIILVHHLEEALRAHALFKKNKDYVVKNGEVVIVDEFTGRMMPGRRYSEGLHQAIEAKEGVEVQRESETLATISFQNLFRLYPKLSGMTGTAATEAEEFWKIYKLDVVVIPTHRPIARTDHQDFIYKTEAAKMTAVVQDIVRVREGGQPVLVGTISVAKSEQLSRALKKANIEHQVLNAKQHEREAKVIMQAGKPGAVTVATNMAGRGVDIILGGANPALSDDTKDDKAAYEQWQKDHQTVLEAGGLHVIGTERHESRRIDNQLRGRAGRQGDAGSSLFYVSMEDDLMRIFGGDRLKSIMDRLGLPEDQPIQHSMISRSIESAQKRVEGHNFDTRKHLVEYDDVMNKHREVVYRKRQSILHLEDEQNWFMEPTWLHEELTALMGEEQRASYHEKEAKYSLPILQQLERSVYLQTIDALWREHLTVMTELQTGIGLQAYGQVDPLVEYKRRGFEMFERLLGTIEMEAVQTLLRLELIEAPQPIAQPDEKHLSFQGADESLAGGGILPTSENPAESAAEIQAVVREHQAAEKVTEPTVGRNDPCPCGSGKKYKKCHGAS